METGGGECLYLPYKGVQQDQELPNTLDCEHVCKVKLPLSSRERASCLVSKKMGPMITGVWI